MKRTRRPEAPTEAASREGRCAAKVIGVLAAALVFGGAFAMSEAAPVQAYAVDASTTVMVVTDPEASRAPNITFISGDLAGSVDDVRSQEIRVDVEGGGSLTYAWDRTVDGEPDSSFADPGANTCSLADIVRNGDYRYTVTVTDESGRAATAAVRVLVSGDYERTPLMDAATGLIVSCSHHKDAQLVVSLLDVDECEHGLLRAAAGGRDLACAYRLAIDGVPPAAQAVIGELQVSVPFGTATRTMTLRAASPEVQEVLFLIEGGNSAGVLEGRKANGRVAFSAPALGAFGIAVEGQGDSDQEGNTPGGDGNEGEGDGPETPGAGGGMEGGSDASGPDDGNASEKATLRSLHGSESLASTKDATGIVGAASFALLFAAVAALVFARRERLSGEG